MALHDNIVTILKILSKMTLKIDKIVYYNTITMILWSDHSQPPPPPPPKKKNKKKKRRREYKSCRNVIQNLLNEGAKFGVVTRLV